MTTEKLPTIDELVSKAENGGAAPVVEAPAAEVPAEAPAVEAEAPKAPEPAPAPKKVEQPHSSRFAALTRKEKESRQREQAASERLAAAEAREKAVQEREARWEAARKNPLTMLREAGFTYGDLTTAIATGEFKEPEVDPIDAKLSPFKKQLEDALPQVTALTKEIEQLKAQLSAKEQRSAHDQAVQEIHDVIKSDATKYELCTVMGEEAVDLVKDVIVEYWKENQKLLDYAEATTIVEQYYEREYVERLASTQKLKSRFPSAPSPTAPKAPKQSAPKEPESPKTLTQSLTSGSEAKVDIDSMSKSEAIAYLAKKLQYR